MWGRRPSEEWPSVVSLVLWWRLSALIARPLPLNLNREIFVSEMGEKHTQRASLKLRSDCTILYDFPSL